MELPVSSSSIEVASPTGNDLVGIALCSGKFFSLPVECLEVSESSLLAKVLI